MWPLIGGFFFFLSGAYIFVAMGLASAIIMVTQLDMSMMSIAQLMLRRLTSYPMLAMPLFMLAGNLLTSGGGVRRMIDFFDAWLCHIRGGLLIVAVAFCIFFAAMTGSGYATIAAVGSIMLPEMEKAGYSERLRSGVISASGQLGNLIPPSITLIIVGMLMERSVATLFAAGLIPGLLVGFGSMFIGIFLARKQGVSAKPPAEWRRRWATLGRAFPCLLMPPIILGGIYGGLFTPTEAATMSCVYAVILGLAVYGGLRSWQNVKSGFVIAMRNSVMIYLIMGGVSLFGYVITRSGMASTLCHAAINLGLGATGLVLILMIFMLGLGFFISPYTLMYIAIPILAPVCEDLGIVLIWLGVLWLMNGLVGAITPPMSPALYIGARVANVEPTTVFRGTIPFLIVWVAVMMLVVFVPEVTLWLPRMMGMRIF